ncbi:MAG: MtrAB system histidine kinase MtrB [Actinomycetes bacterium]
MKSPLKAWRSSLVFRITGTIVTLSIILIWLLGSALFSQVSSGIFDEKLKLSILDAQSTQRNTQIQLTYSKYQDKAALTLVFDDILALPPKTFESSSKEIAVFSFSNINSKFKFDGASNILDPNSISSEFREVTRNAKTTQWERTNLIYLDGKTEPAIVVGQDLIISGVGKYEFYVIFSLTQQNNTMSLILNYLLLAGITLTLLIGLTTYFVMRRLIAPIQDAARVAEELTRGNLNLRMDFQGEDEIASLGYSFNEMAVSLQQQISRLENLSKLQQRFVSDVSHELRTPLTTIRMASQVIFAARNNFEPTVARSSELLVSQIERFQSLLTDLLEVSRFDAQEAVMEIEEIDLIALVRETIDYLHPSQDRIVNLQAPKSPIMVDVDPRRIKRIIRNLVSNALDHREGKSIDIRITEAENEVSVGVRDYGSGFSYIDKKMLFERFWRADSSRARSTGGTGLGLSIALEDAMLHQGEIDAWGERGKGAHFVLTIPKFAGGRIETKPISAQPQIDYNY